MSVSTNRQTTAANAKSVLFSRKNPRPITVSRKASAPVTALVPVNTSKAIELRPPVGGWRTPTVRDNIVMALISAKPGLTAREYGDRHTDPFYTRYVHETIYKTKQGRALAEGGLIAIAEHGRRPFWYYLVNSSNVPLRRRENQFAKVRVPKTITGESRECMVRIQETFREMTQTSSPEKLRDLTTAFNALLLTNGMARAADQKSIADLRQVLIEAPKEVVRLPAMKSKRPLRAAA